MVKSNSSSKAARKLVWIINDHAATDQATGLHIQQDGNGPAIEISGAGNNGIKFGGGASSDANTIDYYEEGTWTPAPSGFTGGTVNDAQYTRIGRFVQVSCKLTSDGTSSSSHFNILGLPFTTSASSSGAASIAHNGSYTGEDGFVQVNIPANASQLTLYESDFSDMTYDMMGFNSSGKYVIITATYTAA